ncbi:MULTISPECIES: site-specific integrase [Clostridia]|uniref:site-specific integrase n=1 Tax=Clostridia TaxID=186801 RepID=UPI000EA403D4|nr:MULTISPECIES: site-specific integrase [Clostridia]NBJ71010.1 site-specific integrase [Roseburia sp. 1XD42-34]RKI75446.1 site-specific integrase [Clostridium sp. 1xD42-85]
MKLNKTKTDDEIYYYVLKSGEKRYMYRHKYYDTLGNRREKKKSGFKTEKEALKSLLGVKAAFLNGNAKQVEHDQITVSHWLDIWYAMNEKSWGVKTKKDRKALIDNYYKPLLGKYKLLQVDKNTYVRQFINRLHDMELSPNTIDLYHNIFKIAINAAVDDEIIDKNRVKKVVVNREKKKDNFLKPEELTLFLTNVKKHGNITNYTLVQLLAYTGLRSGEAAALKWLNIDFKNETVTVEHTRDKLGIRPPKTKNSYRTIKVDKEVIGQLKKYRKWCAEVKLSLGKKLKENDLVFITHHGREIGHYYLGQFLSDFYKKVDSDDISLKKITPHGLRHTHATTLISLGVPPNAIAERLGNTIEMVNKTYAHFFEDLDIQSAIVFGEFLASGAKIGAR